MRSQKSFRFFIVVAISILGQSWAVLRPEDVEEGSCISPAPRAVTPDLQFTLESAQHSNIPFYVPMGSQHLYRAYASYLLGRPPKSQEELDLMNLRIRGSASHTWRTSGFGQNFYQQCTPYGHLFRAFCVAGMGSPATNLKTIRQTTDTLVYTDNKSLFVFARCVMGLWSDWKVLSRKPEVPEATKRKIIDVITQLGFNSSMVAYAKYYD